MADRWWRAYDRSRRDPKLQRLPAETFRGWYNLVCLSSENGGKLPALDVVAFELRKSEVAIVKLLATLEAAELFEQKDGVWSPRKWNTLQYKSDVSTERVKQHRERQRNVSCNVSETPSESENREQRTETEKKDHSAANGADKRGARLADDWQLTPDLRAFAGDLGLDPDLTRVRFDWTINLGHVLTATMFLASTMAAWFSLNSRVDQATAAVVRLEEVIKTKADKDVVAKGELELSRRVVEGQQNQHSALIRIDEGFKEIKGMIRDVDQKLDRKMDKPSR